MDQSENQTSNPRIASIPATAMARPMKTRPPAGRISSRASRHARASWPYAMSAASRSGLETSSRVTGSPLICSARQRAGKMALFV